MLVPAGDYGQASLKKHSNGSWQLGQIKKLSCEMICLDDYTANNNIHRIDFVKCDIEGAELLALRGMKMTLKKHKPKMLLEINDNWTKAFEYTSCDLIVFLKEVGYKSFFKVDKKPISLSDRDLINLSQLDDGANIFCM